MITAVILVCALGVTGALLFFGYALARARIQATAENEAESIRAEAESVKLVTQAQVEMQRKASGDLLEAAKVAAAYGFVIARPDEMASRAAQQGFIVLAPDAYSQLTQAIMARTDISGAGKKLLQQAGLVKPDEEQPRPKSFFDYYMGGGE